MADSGDMKTHISTYNSITKLFRWSMVAIALLVVVVIWLIAG